MKAADVLTHRILPGTSGQTAEGVVDVDDRLVLVWQSDHDALTRRVEYGAGQPETLVGPPVFSHIVKREELRRRTVEARGKRRDREFDEAGVAVAADRQHRAPRAAGAKNGSRALHTSEDRLSRPAEHLCHRRAQHRPLARGDEFRGSRRTHILGAESKMASGRMSHVT